MAGSCTAEALVSHGGFNTLASFQMAMMFGDKKVKCGDQNNADLYKKPMKGTALCLPQTIGSTTGGMVLYTACATNNQPACMLLLHDHRLPGRQPAPSWPTSGRDAKMPVVDELGDEFLELRKGRHDHHGRPGRHRDGGVKPEVKTKSPWPHCGRGIIISYGLFGQLGHINPLQGVGVFPELVEIEFNGAGTAADGREDGGEALEAVIEVDVHAVVYAEGQTPPTGWPMSSSTSSAVSILAL